MSKASCSAGKPEEWVGYLTEEPNAHWDGAETTSQITIFDERITKLDGEITKFDGEVTIFDQEITKLD